MKKVYVVKVNDVIVSWSYPHRMSEDEVEVEMTEAQFKKLLSTESDEPMESMVITNE